MAFEPDHLTGQQPGVVSRDTGRWGVGGQLLVSWYWPLSSPGPTNHLTEATLYKVFRHNPH